MTLSVVKKAANPDQDLAEAVRAAMATADREVPEYRAAIEKRERGLKPRLSALERRRDELLAGLARSVELQTTASRAAAFLQSGDVVDPGVDPGRTAGLRDLRSVEDELPVMREALRLQEGVVASQHARWSAVVCRELKGLYRQLARQAAAAAIEMSTVNTVLQAVGRVLVDTDPESSGGGFHALPHIAFLVVGTRGLREDPFGRLDDPRSGASVYLAELRELGLIE